MAKTLVKKIIRLGGIDLKRYDKALVEYKSLYKKYQAFTMIPEELFIANLDLCNRFSLLEGDVVECGVWRGGMAAAMAEVTGPKKRFHLFDSFKGLPPAKEIDGKEALSWQKDTESSNYHDNCAADESFVIEAFKRAKHHDYTLYKGWFENTLSKYEGGEISILRLDGDWYDSIKICLDKLFPLVKEGGLILLDDYYTWDGCTKAVHDYLCETKSPSRIYQWNNQVAYIIKKH
jgi:O-methyltransferase